jgi:hypothetical protein
MFANKEYEKWKTGVTSGEGPQGGTADENGCETQKVKSTKNATKAKKKKY